MKSKSLSCARVLAVLASVTFFFTLSVFAQTYPTKPVRVIVPFAPGGGTDVLARRVSQKLTELLGRQFVVDNRGGAGGLIGIEMAVRSEPDGYTILITSGSFPASAALYKSAADPINNIAAVAEVSVTPYLLVVHPSLPPTTKQVLEMARSKPGELIYATPGVGTISHLVTEHMLSMAKVRMRHVPYRGAALLMNDLFSGQTQVYIGGLSSLISHVKAGKLRAVAVTTAKRWSALPDVAAIAEALPGFEVESWFGVMAPKGTPRPIVRRLNGTINKFLQEPDLRKGFEALGMEASGGTPEKFEKRIRTDYERWIKVVREAHIKVE